MASLSLKNFRYTIALLNLLLQRLESPISGKHFKKKIFGWNFETKQRKHFDRRTSQFVLALFISNLSVFKLSHTPAHDSRTHTQSHLCKMLHSLTHTSTCHMDTHNHTLIPTHTHTHTHTFVCTHPPFMQKCSHTHTHTNCKVRKVSIASETR